MDYALQGIADLRWLEDAAGVDPFTRLYGSATRRAKLAAEEVIRREAENVRELRRQAEFERQLRYEREILEARNAERLEAELRQQAEFQRQLRYEEALSLPQMARFGRSFPIPFTGRPFPPIMYQQDELPEQPEPGEVESLPAILLQAILIPSGDSVDEGQLIATVAPPWFEILEIIRRAPETIYEIPWRQWEELIAGAYERAGYDEVILTPRSNDGGRDIIASKKGIGSVKIFDQVKRYSPGHLVTAEEVRAMIGVLTVHPNVSKGVVTTTSDFAPGIGKDPAFALLMPYRLELKPKELLLPWLDSLRDKRS